MKRQGIYLTGACDDPGLLPRRAEWLEVEAIPDLCPPDPGAEVVPGLPPALAGPILAGLPLPNPLLATHPDALDWDAVADTGATLVLPFDARERLDEVGLPPETPAARVRHPASPEQTTWTGPLAQAPPIEAGDVLVVGTSRSGPSPYESRPLSGLRVAVTRAAEQAEDLLRRLQDLGARAIPCPAIRFAPPEDPRPLEEAAARAEEFDWLVVTSANAPRPLFEALRRAGKDVRALARARTACIGPATARALEAIGLAADVLPERYVAEGLLEALASHPMEGKKVLIPRAQEAREVLPKTLRERGAEVLVAPAYRTLTAGPPPPELLRGVDLVTFTASSTVRSFRGLLGDRDPAAFPAATIGPVTTKTARELGFPVRVEAREHTMQGLLEAILELAREGGSPCPSP